MANENDPALSPLSQAYSDDGQTVQIEIYDDGEGGWILEIVDKDNNSTLWEDSFDSDDEALAEALGALEEMGIDAFIGPA